MYLSTNRTPARRAPNENANFHFDTDRQYFRRMYEMHKRVAEAPNKHIKFGCLASYPILDMQVGTRTLQTPIDVISRVFLLSDTLENAHMCMCCF